MTRNEAIQLSFKIKEDPSKYDFSGLLYDAVGLVKLETDVGASFAAMKLADAIREVTNNKLSNFCQRRIDIIESEHTKRFGKSLGFFAEAMMIAEYQREQRMMEEAMQRGDYEEDE